MAHKSPPETSEQQPGQSGGSPVFSKRHLLGIADLNQYEIVDLLDRAERMIPV
ncbi:MAG: hypothetical protein HY371_19500, partial [Devosia nanyangense]|nr:hypothetical protein [Devosia nanyangense]